MQNALLDIIIIGCLVSLFASTYRKRTTSMVRAWTLGWLLILVHFAALLLHPQNPHVQRMLMAIALISLIACAAAFLVPSARAEGPRRPRSRFAFLSIFAAVLFVVMHTWDVTVSAPYLAATLVGEGAAMIDSLRLRRVYPRAAMGSLLLSIAASSGWLLWAVTHGRSDVGVSAILFELYLIVAITYMAEFHRVSGGTLTVTLGLLAWSAVFPVAELCAHAGLLGRISPELWNIPKYFVAFGMILVLLEDEIRSASNASKHYRLLFEANPAPMWISSPDTLTIESVNDAAVAQYGYSRDEFCGLRVPDLCPRREDIGKDLAFADEGAPRPHRRRDGTIFLAAITTRQMHSNGRRLSLTLVEDITERQNLHDRLLHQAQHDLLTGLPTRALLEQKLRETLAHSERYSRQSALLCLDVDRFKQINDTYGHAVGDVCLQEVARRISGRLRSVDIVARVGGEEFAVLLHEISNPVDAERVATDLLAALQAPFRTSGFTIELTGSIGIAVYPQDAPDAARLWRNADCAMYRAKRAGGNQFLCMSPEIGAQTSEANELELLLRHALKGEEGLELHFQPIYRTTGELASLEALIRFHHPRFGFIPPDRFVPIAEESGLIVPLGGWVLEEVCRRLVAWCAAGHKVVPVAINVSSRQITQPDFAQSALRMLEKHGVEPHLLGMEITETAMMRNVVEATRQISRLAALGIAFSIDDFGTGYSSLGHIDKLPVQTLKIDRTFIERLCQPNGTYSIVDAIISMAHSLGMKVVAEGVEQTDQLKRLREMGCDTVQGFLFSRPIPADQVPALLASRMSLEALEPDRISSWVA